MARLIIAALLLLPLAEIAGFVLVGQAIGLGMTLVLVVLGAVLGALLLRRQGLAVLSRLRSNLNTGEVPGQSLFDTMALGIAALLLILPGFISDAVALALLVPGIRGVLYRRLAGRVRVVTTTTSYRRQSPPSGDGPAPQRVIELDEQDWHSKDK